MAYPESAPRYGQFGDVTFVRGGVLERFSIDLEVSRGLGRGMYWFWTYEPTFHMLNTQCDMCKKRHIPKNIECSATLGVRSPFDNPNILYSVDERFENVRPTTIRFVDYGGKINGCVVYLSRDNIYAQAKELMINDATQVHRKGLL
jgi:hypothetical protein